MSCLSGLKQRGLTTPLQSWRLATARWASGRRCEKVFPRDSANSDAGSTRQATSSIKHAQDACNLERRSRIIHEIWMAETRERCVTRRSTPSWRKYASEVSRSSVRAPQARIETCCITFYDFPAEHWKHLRTTNPIESTFATIRLRHRRTKGCGTRRASLAMMFKLAQSAQKRWRRLNGHDQLVHLLQGKKFVDGVLQDAA